MSQFVHLHLHSEYSLLDGACRIRDIPEKARQMGHTACAITDHGAMYGAVAFSKACRAAGIKPIIGCEVYLARRSMYDKDKDLDAKSTHLVLLCKNETGYRNLCLLVSKAFTDGFYSKPRIDLDLLKAHSEGLIALSACLAGAIPRFILSGEYDKAEEHARLMGEIFGEGNFYLEVQDHGLRDDDTVNRGIRVISNRTGIPMVATNDVHYLDKKDAETQAILLCIQTNNVITDGRPIGFETDEFYYKSTEEMEELFADYRDACANTVKIAEQCNFDFTFGETKLPRYHPENGMEPADYLRTLAEEGLERRVAEGHIVFDEKNTREVYEERMAYELSVISKMGYSEYYLIVWDFVNASKRKGIPVGPGRGSGAGSIVAYLVGITDIDSIRFNLLFERFLNPERVSMPDFDIDFCYDRRDEAIAYVREKYGEEHTAQIITFGTLAARAAVKDVGRALGMSIPDVDEVTALIPRELNITLEKAMQGKELRALYDSDPAVRRLIDTASALEGMPRHASTHAAGVVITELPVTSYVPVASNGGVTVTQYDMDTIADLGLLKFDFLALRYLTIINHAEMQIRERIPDFDLTKAPMDDSATYDNICRGRTDGVFQLESGGIRQMLMQLKPRCLDDIIASIALYRPGPMDSIPKYIEARHDPSKIHYCTPALAPILDVTYGCIVYQEQVMQIFREIAGYSFGHADVVRRAISKKKQGVLDGEREAFLRGAVERGISEPDAAALFDDIVSFANYAFNKSHAAAYAVISYRTAYLKTHFPREYISALLTSVLGQTEKIAEYMADCRKRGIEVLPPDINYSYSGFHVDGEHIRFGLSALRNVGVSFIESVIAERTERGLFRDFTDFVSRMKDRDMNKRQLEALIKSGALDSLGARRSQMLAVYEQAMERRNSTIPDGQIDMFAEIGDSMPPPPRILMPDIPELGKKELLNMEKESAGMYLLGHLADDYSNHLSALNCDSVGDILRSGEPPSEDGYPAHAPLYEDKASVTVAGVITKRVGKTTKNGEEMAFVTVEDKTGEIEILFFPKPFARFSHILPYGGAVIVSGRLSIREGDAVKILADKALPLMNNQSYTAAVPQPNKTVAAAQTAVPQTPSVQNSPVNKIFLRVDSTESKACRRALALMAIFEGNVPVILYDKESGAYLKEKILSVGPTPFVIGELKALLGEENVVIR